MTLNQADSALFESLHTHSLLSLTERAVVARHLLHLGMTEMDKRMKEDAARGPDLFSKAPGKPSRKPIKSKAKK